MRTRSHCPDCRMSVTPLYERRRGKFCPVVKSVEGADELYPGQKEFYVMRAFYCDSDKCRKLVWIKSVHDSR